MFSPYPQVRASGVEGLGSVPAHWSVKRLRFVTTLNPSRTEVASLDRQTEVTFLPMEAVGEDGSIQTDRVRPIAEVETGYTFMRDGDVVIAKVTPCFENGKGAHLKGLTLGIAFGTTELIVARPDERHILGRYLHWLFVSPDFRKQGEAAMYGAGGQKRVPDDFVRNFYIGLPPLVEQEVIAAFLDRETAKIDTLIAEQERLIALLDEKRRAVISHAVTKGLNPDAPMKHSGIEWLGEVPAHWRVQPLRRFLVLIEQGWSPQCLGRPADLNEWGVLKAGCVNGGTFDEQQNKSLPVDLEPLGTLEVKRGDVIMSRASGSRELIGSTAYVSHVRPRLMLSDKLYRLHLRDYANPNWWVYFMKSAAGRFQIGQSIGGAEGLANNISQTSLMSFLAAVPPIREQMSIVNFLDDQMAVIERLGMEAHRAIGILKERRSALISAAVTGKIDVRRIETEAEAA